MSILPSTAVATAAERREKVLALTQSLPHAVWRGDSLGRGSPTVIPTGYEALASELPAGGWPAFGLTELLWAQPGSGEFRLLLPALKTLSDAGRMIVILGAPHALIAPAFEQHGIDITRILVVQADKPADRLWAAEQVLKTSVGALLAWHPQVKAEQLRRLQVAASGCNGLTFIFRSARARSEPSPAPLRLFCEAEAFGQLSVDVFKRRGPAASQPVVLPPLFPQSLNRALKRAQRSAAVPVTTDHALDFRLPAEPATRPRVPSLA